MEIFIVLSVDSGFSPIVEGAFYTQKDAEEYLDFLDDKEKEFYIQRSFLK